MANLKVSSQELDAILGELEGELSGLLAGTQSKLSKAREEEGSPSAGMGSASASAGSPSAGSPSAGSPSAGGAPDMGASPEGAPAGAPPSAPPAGDPGMEGAPAGEPGMEGAPEGAPAGEPGMEGAPGGDPAQDGAMDPQALEAEYAQLPLEELKAHYLAAKAALYAQMQGGGEQGAPQGAPPPAGPSAGAPQGAPPAGPPQDPSAGPPMAMNAPEKFKNDKGNGGEVKPGLSKAEDALQAQVDALTKIVTAFVNKPMQKAITGTTYVAKSEGETPAAKALNPSEVTAQLSTLTRSPDLKKSDRDLITGYYEGRTKLDAIVHLLK